MKLKCDQSHDRNSGLMTETAVRKQTETKKDRIDEQESPTLPEETPATTEHATSTSRSNIKEGHTHGKHDEEEGKDNI